MFGYIYYAIIKSVYEMLETQSDLFEFTEETKHREPNFSTHLANEIHKYLTWLSFEVDIVKPNYSKQRPDIVFHRRGIHRDNLLVIEVKRYRNEDVDKDDWSCNDDDDKIKNDWFTGKLKYQFGISIVLNDETKEFRFVLFQNEPRKTQTYFSPDFDSQFIENDEIEALIYQINSDKRKARESNYEIDTTELEREIDRLVYQLYELTDEEIAIVEGRS